VEGYCLLGGGQRLDLLDQMKEKSLDDHRRALKRALSTLSTANF
jgi:hypothetical protein